MDEPQPYFYTKSFEKRGSFPIGDQESSSLRKDLEKFLKVVGGKCNLTSLKNASLHKVKHLRIKFHFQGSATVTSRTARISSLNVIGLLNLETCSSVRQTFPDTKR